MKATFRFWKVSPITLKVSARTADTKQGDIRLNLDSYCAFMKDVRVLYRKFNILCSLGEIK